ncbi:MAG TPA: TolC family protein [Povalibacter sp.]|nr:TolC family protein [Povalibacter sp.]
MASTHSYPATHPAAVIAACLVLVALGAACSTSPLKATPPQLPSAFESPASGTWPELDWYRGFASAELDALVLQAQQNNLDLVAAEARVRQADARSRAAGGAILPQVDGRGDIARIAGESGGQSARETDWSALIAASYEVDFWGRRHAEANSAQYSAQASAADRDTLMLTIRTAVADDYFQVLSLRERVVLARASLEAAGEVLKVIEARFNAGAASAAELAAQRAAVANAELAIAPLERQELEARGALALLVGRAPEGFTVDAQSLDGLQQPRVSPDLPANLLLRRPDVFVAERGLEAAHADLIAARAALFPTLTLTGSGGVQDPAVQAAVITLAGSGPSLTLGASLVQSIFDGGQRRAVRDEAQAKEEELLAIYRSAILNALLDVETALSAIERLNRQQAAQEENVTQSARAFEAARLRYRAGAGDYLSVLDAQRTLYAAQEQSSQYKLARLQAAVGLCKALGGGWQQPDVTEQHT